MRVSSEAGSAQSAYWTNGARPFLVGVDDEFGDARITVHASRTEMSREQARQMKRLLRQEGVFSRFRVKRYRGFGVQSGRTLEAFLAPFTHDHILYDSTGDFQRTQKLIRFASAARASLGRRVVSLFWQQRSGTLYLVLDPRRYPKQSKARRSELARVEPIVRKTLRTTCGARATEFVKGVRIGFNLPRDPAIPIDERSANRRLH